jgi:hypothetical protein
MMRSNRAASCHSGTSCDVSDFSVGIGSRCASQVDSSQFV